MTSEGRYHFRVGDLACTAIQDAVMGYPIDEVFPNVPREQLMPALAGYQDSSTEIVFDFACLLIDTGKKRILIDAGCGPLSLPTESKLTHHLQAEGIAPKDIDAIAFTHGDGDHIGGIGNANGKSAFPNARCIMRETGWDALLNTDWTQMPDEVADQRRKLAEILQGQMEPVKADVEFLPGFRFIPAAGHKPGHAAVAISSAGEHLLHVGDAIGHPIMVTHPEWSWTFDMDHAQAAGDRRRLMERAMAQDSLIFGSHLPFPGVGRVVRHQDELYWRSITVKKV